MSAAGVVLVTGASRGLGASIARTLAAAGWAVAVNYRHGATVNVVAPGWVPVERHAGVAEDEVGHYVAEVPLGRIGRPEDVAGAVRWLLSDAASFVTGERVTVNGGHTIG
jgi:3-oxoacyl-[acyl-carrier protein] reductase